MSEWMTSRQRVLATLDRQEPDRVPIFELMTHPNIIESLLPEASYEDFVETLGIDAPLTFTPSSLYAQEVVGVEDGTTLIRTEWGEVRAKTADIVPLPIRHPVVTHADWERYQIPEARPDRLSQLDSLVKRFKGQKAIGVHLHDAFSYPTYIFGMSELFLKLYEEPDWVKEVIAACVDHSLHMIRFAAEGGADFVVFGDDYGGKSGPLISPKLFREFFLPGLAQTTQAAKASGLYVIKHTDGNITSILGSMVEAGIDAFHPSDPSAGMDIVKVKAQYGDRLCVVGGMDVADPLCDWPVDQAAAEVRKRISELAPGGGWMIASSNSLHASVKPENYAAMVWATRAYGQYDQLNKVCPIPELESRWPFLRS
jgi:uroporphyrinogen decarboxylase